MDSLELKKHKQLENISYVAVPTTKPNDAIVHTAPLFPSKRLIVALLLLYATWTTMFQRLTINFGIICMVKRTTFVELHNISLQTSEDYENSSSTSIFHEASDCPLLPKISNSANFENGDLEWNRFTQGQVLASFYYGLVFTSAFGGLFSQRFGPRSALIWSVLVISVLSILTPFAAKISSFLLIFLRVLQGIANAATMPAVISISSQWFPDVERGFLLGIAYSGFNIATVLIYPISAFFCKYTGWPTLFYWSGAVGLLFCMLTQWLIMDWPEKNNSISRQELEFIQTHRAVQCTMDKNGNTQLARKKLDTPWKKILTSGPVWALNISHFCAFWIFITIGMYLPTYLKEVLHQDITKNGVLSAVPFAVTLIFHFIIAILFDRLRKRQVCGMTKLRKIFNSIGMFVAAFSTLAIGFIPCDATIGAVMLLTFGQVFIEVAIMGGYTFSVFELAPKYAPTITGVMNTFGLAVGLVGPLVVSNLTPDGTREQWLHVFYISAAISLFGGICYLIFGSADLQKWAAIKPIQDNGKETDKYNENDTL